MVKTIAVDHTGFPLSQPSEADPVALTTSQMRAVSPQAKATGTQSRGSQGRTLPEDSTREALRSLVFTGGMLWLTSSCCCSVEAQQGCPLL